MHLVVISVCSVKRVYMLMAYILQGDVLKKANNKQIQSIEFSLWHTYQLFRVK